MLLKGKTAFITGGTGGIGVPLVRLLRDAGANVTVYDTKRDGDLVSSIEVTCAHLRKYTPDILINMAGFNVLDYCENQDLESIVALNMMAPMLLTQSVLPGMKARGSGHIVNIGSMTALIPLPHLTGYVAAKSGLRGFNDSLRRELGGTGITLTHIVPRAVKTPMNGEAKAEVNRRTGVNYDDPNDVAHRIFSAIIKKKRELRFGWPERVFAFINANFPGLIDGGLQKTRRIGEQVLGPSNARNKRKEAA